MELLFSLIDFVLHIDKHLNTIIQNYGVWAYAIIFVIIFCETGLVVTPFLPGDSLLFAAGAIAALGAFDAVTLVITISTAAFTGDTVNYWVGYFVGPKIFHKENVRFLNKKYLDRTHQFYERHGGKTIFIARFMPIIRTFAPFVAGIARMRYLYFVSFSITVNIVWPVVFITSGYFFGNIPFVKKYFSLVILAIIFISVLPIMIEIIRMRLMARKEIKRI